MATCVHSSRTQSPPRSRIEDDHVLDGGRYPQFFRPPPSPNPNPNRITCSNPAPGMDQTSSLKPPEVPTIERLWSRVKDEAASDVNQEPILSTYYYTSILSHDSMEGGLANHLSMKLSDSILPVSILYDLFYQILTENREIMESVAADLRAVKDRDPACISYVHCFLNFKGFLACQAHRIAHKLWSSNRKTLAFLVQNRVSEVFAVDIHPGAKLGSGILLDHATGVVIGETAVIGNNVSILHNVTLGGTGKECGDRHPKIGEGVLIGAGTCVLGNVRIGYGAKIGVGSVVLNHVPERTTAVGNPARLLGGKQNPKMLDKIPSLTMDHTSHIHEWSDYVI